MKKILIVLLMMSMTTAFAGDIWSMNDTYSQYISVTEVAEENYAFELCDQETDICSKMAEGHTYDSVTVKKIVKSLRRSGRARVGANIAIGVGIYAITGGIGVAIGSITTAAGPFASFYAINSVPSTVGTLIGIGGDIAFAIKNPLGPGQFFKLADAVEQSTMTSGKVFVKKYHVADLAVILEKKLLKFKQL